MMLLLQCLSRLPHRSGTCINVLVWQWPVCPYSYYSTFDHACLIVRAASIAVSKLQEQPRLFCACRHCVGTYDARTKTWPD